MIEAQCIGFLNTPPLWKNKQFSVQQFEFPNLNLQLFYPKSLPGNMRLGHQMEYVFKQLVEYSDVYEVILHNLQISKAKRTLGEIDFILKDKATGKLIHVELTFKFYVIDPEISEPIHRLIGPNRKDAFIAKIEKIKNIQYPLLHSEEGNDALQEYNIDHLKIEHQCCFRAQLFMPYGNERVDIHPLNKDCIAGYWLPYDEFNTSEFADAQYYLPTKSEWVIEVNDQVEWKMHREILLEIDTHLANNYAPMLWVKKTNADFEKIFVVWW